MTKNKNTGVAVISSPVDGMELIDKKIASMKRIAESVFKTKGQIDEYINLKTETSIEKIIKGIAGIMTRSIAYEKAATAIGKSTYPVFSHEGSSVEEWIEDAKLRIDIIEQKDTLDKLNQLKSRMVELMDKEDKMRLLQDDMAKLLGE